MVNRLPSWLFMALAMTIMGFALMPLMRALFGIDSTVQMEFLSVVVLLIAGLMCGLTAMLLLVRRQPPISYYKPTQNLESVEKWQASMMHASGLLIFTGVPLANFLACYYVWLRNRHKSEKLDRHGREAICFQITIYLYLMMCLFMSLVLIGVFAMFLLLFFHLACVLVASYQASQGALLRYPANIAIIDRMLEESQAEP